MDGDVDGKITKQNWIGYSPAECNINSRERGNWRVITANFHNKDSDDDDDDEEIIRIY